MTAAGLVKAWEARGTRVSVGADTVFVCDVPARTPSTADPLLVLHGFPTCSFDFRLVVDALAADRRVILLDFLGFGLSDKPDRRYGIRMQADAVEAVARALGLESVALLSLIHI